MKQYLFTIILTAAITFALTWAVWKLSLRFKLYPAIRDRDVHTTPKPRLGGVAIFLAIAAAFGFSAVNPFFQSIWVPPQTMWSILGASLLIAIIGVVDDLWDIDWMIKLGAQFLAAGVITVGGGLQILSLPFGDLIVVSSWLSITITMFAIVIVMNAVNFIDGLDGLVAGVALIANAVFFVYTYLVARDTGAETYSSLASFIAVALVAVCLGFLPLNWSPSKLFMGDSGALLIGLLMAVAAIAFTGSLDPALLGDNDVFGRSQLLGAFIPILLPVVVVLLPLLDFGMAVIRRMGQGKSPFSPDRKHLHHRMLDMGHSDRAAVVIFYAWTAVVSLGVLLMYMGTSRDWPGDYWPGVAFLVIGAAACVAVTLLPSAGRRPATASTDPDTDPEPEPEPRTS